MLCYAIGLGLILRRYVGGETWRLADDWDNKNCILHGALSISGLAAVVSDHFSAQALLVFWLIVAVVAEPLSSKLMGAEKNQASSWLPAKADLPRFYGRRRLL